MKALINTFAAIPGDSIGRIVSLHRTEEAAREADSKLQRAVKQGNGRDSYLPTRIVTLAKGRWQKGQHVHALDVVSE